MPMFHRFILPILLLFCSLQAYESIYFMPKDANRALNEIVEAIDSAKSSIDIAMFSFTNRTIAKELKKRAKEGVKIRIIFDKKANAKDEFSSLGYLAKYENITAYTISGEREKNGKYSGKMHLKLAVIDNKKAIFGSANWSSSAFSINHELLYVTDSEKIVKECSDYFGEIVKKSDKY